MLKVKDERIMALLHNYNWDLEELNAAGFDGEIQGVTLYHVYVENDGLYTIDCEGNVEEV